MTELFLNVLNMLTCSYSDLIVGNIQGWDILVFHMYTCVCIYLCLFVS